MSTKRSTNFNIIHNLTHEAILYNLDWLGYDGQAVSRELYNDRDAFEISNRHNKQRILDSMSDQDIWQIMRDKQREKSESAIKCAEFFQRELNHRKNPERFKKEDLSKLKEQVEILDVIEHYIWTFRYRPGSLIKCPFPDHADGTASFSINTKKNFCKCFGCGKWWSAIDFIMHMEWCDLPTAINKFKSFV